MSDNRAIKSITMYSTSWCADCYRAKQFFKEYNIDYLEINIEQNPEAATLVEELNHGNRSVPTIMVDYTSDKEDQDSTTRVLVEPSRQELEEFFTPHEK